MAEGWDGRNRNSSAAFRTVLGEWKERIVIQKSRTGTDKAGNHVLFWEDYYFCAACVNNLSGKEYWEAAQVSAQTEVYFLIRYCSEVAAMDTEHYRVLFRGQVYNITFLDNVKYRNKILKLRASLMKR
ncbi:phage head closure protein [Lactonifactor longoviformis]|uniref:phage head closure protein n=1 Tax=Lactonifactor longoviformis TaxID=341220 RepID=UPI0036F3A75D